MTKDAATLTTLKKRSDFILASKAKRKAVTGFILQARERAADELSDDQGQIRVGYTCSKKVGNAVMRNRAKRRLREIARTGLQQHGLAGWDYVLIGRNTVTGTRDFSKLEGDLAYALRKLHGGS
ncbi:MULTISPECIES: ribonuclease P protein component [Halocynthiibacter]|uniref:Ribonuclease P protein component n=1 Tax=Halocynthiibacter halioticoli TaxID=2986804 RepID=A0AAE3J2E3_9RHOB|nr:MULTISPECIES: ribonuclease P protein component [Halocynthiibacter]MCV6825486.1 ribonuclease P protein component [Halocynthiibacter halioticoli]MCW4058487.1 ribonuclease P protein component [Halocynthiibacter sp. SDUM655004]